ncbi:hypothetical protein [Helicobacter sp.]|uniref:hypothetical protein n=1 Tax=Helicobacter sp. TaxID=218 RepID=UPI0025C4DE10|nr:hypothetical protein [Helicobacter sp.]MCI5968561.1 hypothetical protein [Helicobacter sp.]MDY2584771.1 hypothetical protein [Helicobacter sp.]
MCGGGGFLAAKAISLGVSKYSPWDLEMAEMGYKVIEYDGSIEKSPYDHPNITFHKKFIGTRNDASFITLGQVIADNGFIAGENNILQCDIENSEWDMLQEIEIESLSKCFTQVIFEFHGCNPEEQDGVNKRTKILECLRKYFTPIHTHFNNHGKIFYSKGLFFSTTIEVSYLRNDLAESYFKNGFRESCGELEGLDSPSFLANPEIPIRFSV